MKNIIIFLFLLGLVLNGSAQQIPKNLAVKDLNGKRVFLQEIVRDSTVVLIFWATWCKPCQSELESLAEQTDAWQGKLPIIAISIDDSRASAKVKSLVKGKRWPFQVYQDTNKELYTLLNINSIPYSVILKNGKVVWSHTGYVPGNEQLMIEKALQLK